MRRLASALAILLPSTLFSACGSDSGDSAPAETTDGGTTTGNEDASSGGRDAPSSPGCEIKSQGRPGTVAVSATREGMTGNAVWETPENGREPDEAFANATLSDQSEEASESEELRITGFGFTIPSKARIVGLEIELQRRAEGPVVDGEIGFFLGDERSRFRFIMSPWTEQIIGLHDYGGLDETWGRSWTPDEVAREDFGARLFVKRGDGANAIARVDSMRVTVHYCEDGP